MIKYFPIYWMDGYSIVKIEVVREARMYWYINQESSEVVYGKYAFLQYRLRKKDYPAFDTISEAAGWIVDHIQDRIEQTYRIIDTLELEKLEEQEKLNKLLNEKV